MYPTKSPSKRPDVYQIVTDKILELLDAGTVPWHKPWRGGAAGKPKNAISKKSYRGVNVFLLGMTAIMEGYDSPFWVTYQQAKQLGGNVRKGQKSTLIVFYRMFETSKTLDTGKIETKTIPMLRYYNVFNLDQCDNVTVPKAETVGKIDDLEFEPIEACEHIVAHYKDTPGIYHDGGGRAYYRPASDSVHLPERRKFENVEEYYSTLFHELAHSTGHESRLNRHDNDQKQAAFGSADYSKEELIAEMGAAFLSGTAGIESATIELSAAYIDGWRGAIKGNKKLVVQAAAAAQKASDYILGENGGAK